MTGTRSSCCHCPDLAAVCWLHVPGRFGVGLGPLRAGAAHSEFTAEIYGSKPRLCLCTCMPVTSVDIYTQQRVRSTSCPLAHSTWFHPQNRSEQMVKSNIENHLLRPLSYLFPLHQDYDNVSSKQTGKDTSAKCLDKADKV